MMIDHRPDALPAGITGLTLAEVRRRTAEGLTNRVPSRVSRPFRAIVAENTFTLFNAILFGMVILLLVVGEQRDAFLIGALVLFTVLISIFQETRAKLRLDRIALLAQPRVEVIRAGQVTSILPGAVVQGDDLILQPGNQVVADGEVVCSDGLEINEALLTGEATPARKRPGDAVLSGSYCVGGSGVYLATRVGEASYLQQLTRAARRFQIRHTPLQRFINRILRLLLAVVIALSALQLLAFLVEGFALIPAVRATAVIATLVPQGLLLMSTAAYSLGALRVARHDGLVQRLSAVEELSQIDLLCMDKTGTLTIGHPELNAVIPFGRSEDEARALVGAYAASAPHPDTSLEAIKRAISHEGCPILASVPFQFASRWSSLTLGEPCPPGTYVLGAPEALFPYLATPGPVQRVTVERAALGQRVLLLAQASGPAAVEGSAGPALSPGLEAVAVIALAEQIRPEAAATVRTFQEQGVTIKLLSGDHPETVRAIALRIGLPAEIRAISGPELAALSPSEFARVVRETTVFGRVDPQEKEQIVRELRTEGKIVAMVGDGANDILAMKAANLGIAMQSGTPATRGVADVVLLQDSFAALPAMLGAGRRIVNGMHALIDLFLIRDIGTIELILATGFIDLPFPYLPPQITLVAMLTVGIPSVFLVAWAAPTPPPPDTLARVTRVSLPLGSAIGVATLAVYLIYWLVLGAEEATSRSAVVATAILSGLIALIALGENPAVRVGPGAATRRVVILAAGCLIIYILILLIPPAARLFEIHPLTWREWSIVIAVVIATFAALNWGVRQRILRRITED